jgi:hypothetical protein
MTVSNFSSITSSIPTPLLVLISTGCVIFCKCPRP